MEISEDAEELLETLWTRTEEKEENNIQDYNTSIIQELKEKNLVTTSPKEAKLTKKGQKEAETIVRCHRLAERLLLDLLNVGNELIEDTACKFEHLLHKGIDDKICTLLGHPKYCPHGKPIPTGKCCTQNIDKAEQVITSLIDLEPGEKGRISYIHTKAAGRLKKLMAMNILPGRSISLIQKFPSYVFQVGQTQIAADEEIAGSIYVRL